MDTNDQTRENPRRSEAPSGKERTAEPRRQPVGTMNEPWKKPVRPEKARRNHEETVRRETAGTRPAEQSQRPQGTKRTGGGESARQSERPQQPRRPAQQPRRERQEQRPQQPRREGQEQRPQQPRREGQEQRPQQPKQRRPQSQNARYGQDQRVPRPTEGTAPQRSIAPDEVFHPEEDRTVERPVRSEEGRAAPARSSKKKKGAASDSGYQPYRAANQRKKAEKKSSFKRFFSGQNPVLRTFARMTDKGDTFAEDSEIARKRKAQREADAARKRKKQNAFSAPAVVYTQPQAFNRDRLLVQLLTVLAVVVALVLGLSVFFKVKTITISGAEVYSPWAVREASGIKEGDNLLTFGRARASGQITANLPYVKSVRIGIKLPDTVNIEIDEENVVYAIKSEEGIWWLMNSDGKVVEMANSSVAKNYTQVLGVTLTAPQVNGYGVATEDIPTETDADGEYIPLTVTGAQRLYAALQILQALEANDIVGDAASVDVSRMEDIILWYGSRYQVNLGDTSRMDYKIACMCDVILQMSDYQTGILDISFTTWADQVGYTPFQ